MKTSEQLEELMFLVRQLAERLLNDIELASTREEHIRITARANEAENLADMIQRFMLEELKKETQA